MNAQEYLQQYEEATRIVQREEKEYKEQQELIDNIRSSLGGDGLPKSGDVRKEVEEKATKLADKALDVLIAKIEAMYVRQEINGTIRKVPGVAGEVLSLRYIKLKKWDEIAKAVNYSERRVFDYHKEGLDAVEKIINCRTLQ